MKKEFLICLALTLLPMVLVAQIIQTRGSTAVMDGEYNVMNNVWGSGPGVGDQMLEVDLAGTYFKVILSEHNNGNSVASYPAIFKGSHWGWATTKNNPMPVKIKEVETAPFTWVISTKDVLGTWNAAFEAWFHETGVGTNYSGELMIWIDYHGGASPGGSKQATVNIGGYTWDVYFAVWDWNYIAYRIQSPVDSVSLDLRDFIHDSVTRGFLFTPWHLVNMEAGFEIWSDGQGLTSHSYSANVTETTNTINYPPTSFRLLSPRDNRTIGSSNITFKWQEAIDPDLDLVEYIFYLFGSDADTIISGLEENSFEFDGSNFLQYDTTYTWYVDATDGTDTTASTTQRTFRVLRPAGLNLINQIPGKFSLGQNYPNPFNSQTVIIFEIEQSIPIELSVFDLLGRKVQTLKNGFYEPGDYRAIFDASRLPSGNYYYQLVTSDQCLRRKCLSIK